MTAPVQRRLQRNSSSPHNRECHFRIWRADRGSALAISELARTTFRETFEAHFSADAIDAHSKAELSQARFCRHLDAGASVLLGERQGGPSLSGYAVIGPATDAVWHLSKLYVRRSEWGSGLGAALIGAVANQAGMGGAELIRLESFAHNHRAIAFYRKHGFRLVGEGFSTIGGTTQPGLLMELDLG